jgi:hypothetical protein
MEVKLEHLNDQFYFDVFTTAMERGSTYWADVLDYYAINNDGKPFLLDFCARIRDEESDDKETYVIDRTTIERGIQYILNDASNCHVPQTKKNLLEGRFDATDADCILQAGIMGEIIYG